MRTLVVILVLHHLLATVAMGQLQRLVIPKDEFSEGNAAGGGPFLVTGVTNSARFQQVYGAAAFQQLLPQGGWITGISFRADTPFDGRQPVAVLADIRDIQINLSTTTKLVDGLSPAFSENVGLNDQVVYDRGPLQLRLSTSGRFPQPFSSSIALTPFFYQPGAGNLLLDVRTFVGYPPPPPPTFGTPFMDAEDRLGDFVSVASSFASVFADSGLTGTGGFITRFDIIPVPEPSLVAILALGAVALSYTVWQRNRNRNSKSRARGTRTQGTRMALTSAFLIKPHSFIHNRSGVLKYFGNRTVSGKLEQGFDNITNQKSADLAISVADALVLSL